VFAREPFSCFIRIHFLCACAVQSGLLLGIPVVFDTDQEDIKVGDKVLITYKGQNIGVLNVESKWCPDKVRDEAQVQGLFIRCSYPENEHCLNEWTNKHSIAHTQRMSTA